MTLARLKRINRLAIPLMLALASGDAAVASPAQSGQTVYVDGLDAPVQLPVVFPPVKKIAAQPTEQELRTRAETGNVEAMEAYANFLPTPSDFPWYLKAAEGGSPSAMVTVAYRAKGGQTDHGIDLPLSEKWFNKVRQIEAEALSRKDAKMLRTILKAYEHSDDLDAATKAQYALVVGRAGGFDIEDGFSAVLAAFPPTPEKVQLLERCSSHGHPWCTNLLAFDYLNGSDGLIIDHTLGITLLMKVAQAGYNIDGNSKAMSQAEKIQLYKTAIEHGRVDYCRLLALAYLDGDGVPKSAPIAAALLRTLIQRPDIDGREKGEAIWRLASMYVDGKSFPVNEQLFLRVLNLASSSDKSSRQALTECLVQCGEGLLFDNSLNITESTRLQLFKSVVENSAPFNDIVYDQDNIYYRYLSALKLGDLYSSGQKMKQSYADAMTWYQKAEQIATSHMGHDFIYDGVSAVKIGLLYEKGLGVPKDSSTAISWYQKAVNNLMSQINHTTDTFDDLRMGSLIQVLDSIPLPQQQVISFIRPSAEADNEGSQYYLGKMYYEGKYVPQSYSEAAGWFEKCGNHSEGGWRRDCLGTLGKIYLQGQGGCS
jgi:TPR repeat protein